MRYGWIRSTFQGSGQTGYRLLASVQPGYTLTRIRFGWNFGGAVSSYTDLASLHGEQMVFGIQTTIGPGTEVPTYPVDEPGDADPPAWRWLWWEGRSATVDGFSPSATGTCLYTSKQPTERSDAKAQVRAPSTIPVGSTLNVWASWETDISWPAAIDPYLTGWASVLATFPPL